MEINGYSHKTMDILFHLEPDDVAECDYCDSDNIRKKDKTKRYVWTIIEGQPTYVMEQIPRFYCRDCKRTFIGGFRLFEENIKSTNEFNQYLAQTLISNPKTSIRSMANKYGLSPTYCSKALHQYVESFDEKIITVKGYPIILLIPMEYEQKVRCFVCGKDRMNSLQLLGILNDYSPDSLSTFVKTKMSNPSIVSTLYCDLQHLIAESVNQLFPNAEICILRQSMIKEANKYDKDTGDGLFNIKNEQLSKFRSIVNSKNPPRKREVLSDWWFYVQKPIKKPLLGLWNKVNKDMDECVNTLFYSKNDSDYRDLRELVIIHRKMKTDFPILQLKLLFTNQAICKEIKSSSYGRYIEHTQIISSHSSEWYNYHVDLKRLKD